MSQFKKYDSGMSWDQLIKRGKDKTAIKKVTNPTGFQADSLRINANRIKNGEDIGHYWLEGRLKKQLLEYTDVTEKDFEKYVAPTAQMQYVKPYNYKENKIGEDNWTEETSSEDLTAFK